MVRRTVAADAVPASSAVAGEGACATPRPEWRRRWTMIRLILGFCAALIFYLSVFGPDDRLRESALCGLLALTGSVALGYLGFAVQDDRNWLQSLRRENEEGAR